ncbi:L-aspartate oxidase [Oikeobacillus pervagus]|uniref:L-aspartate oxidase n=1 Tax=Oikeobacillus pervagus TaxID=1325931 RepID=A0AAJ1T0N6_9BACI|nr:L-aspartate oxidase [Oikeobacillus pervagus]MDQ0214571.1 L-aspartate oxidase [Oikeobacillus pervagus]
MCKTITNVIIIGSGISALQLSKYISEPLNVIIITKLATTVSNSYKAQGGIASVLSEKDQFTFHIQDTLTAGRFHQSEEAVNRLVQEGSAIVKGLVQEGLPVDRDSDGHIDLGLEGAHSQKRIVHCGGDATGKHVVDYLLETIHDRVTIMEHEFAYELLLTEDRSQVIGVKTKNEQGEIKEYFAQHIVLASGGMGGLYPYTSNQSVIFGDGIAMAYRAGAELTDLEFIQFHPTLLYVNGETKGLVSEAVRGEGGILVDEDGKRIMENVHPLKDLAPRHVTAFEIYKTRNQGKNVFLNITDIDHFSSKFPTITKLCEENGISIEKGLIPVTPGSHFLMGGILIDAFGRTSLKGLYAIGETACSGVHGANRLASNSLLEGLVFGKRTAEFINHAPIETFPESTVFSYQSAIHQDEVEDLSKTELQQSMMEHLFVVRDEQSIQEQIDWLRSHHVESFFQRSLEQLSIDKIQLVFMYMNSYLVSTSALLRKESRGAHIRADFPKEELFWKDQQIIHTVNQVEVRSCFYEHDQVRTYA